MTTIEVRNEFYFEALKLQVAAEGLGPSAQRRLQALITLFLENEQEAEKLVFSFDWERAKQIYDNRTLLLAESYDFLQASAN